MEDKILDYGDVLLRRQDALLLLGNNWLNDQVQGCLLIYAWITLQHAQAVTHWRRPLYLLPRSLRHRHAALFPSTHIPPCTCVCRSLGSSLSTWHARPSPA